MRLSTLPAQRRSWHSFSPTSPWISCHTDRIYMHGNARYNDPERGHPPLGRAERPHRCFRPLAHEARHELTVLFESRTQVLAVLSRLRGFTVAVVLLIFERNHAFIILRFTSTAQRRSWLSSSPLSSWISCIHGTHMEKRALCVHAEKK